jgi:hypothetical protein
LRRPEPGFDSYSWRTARGSHADALDVRPPNPIAPQQEAVEGPAFDAIEPALDRGGRAAGQRPATTIDLWIQKAQRGQEFRPLSCVDPDVISSKCPVG